MRPCNQCGTPIENKEQICADCENYNLENGIQRPPPVSISPYDPSTEKPVPIDQSVNTLAISFLICAVISLGLMGLLIHGWIGFLIGAVIGCVVSVIIPSMMR